MAAQIVRLAERPRATVFAGRVGLAGAILHELLHPSAPHAIERQLAPRRRIFTSANKGL